jgi:GNAT superfamily N-acetyltransferase
VAYLHAEFSAEIERGCTYPMEQPMTLDKFRDYWFGTFAVVALIEEELTKEIGLEERDWEKVCLGTFYIKPNYPGESPFYLFCNLSMLVLNDVSGRCSHVCNAGFLTCTAARGQGTGTVMGKAYLEYAPKLVINLFFSLSWVSFFLIDIQGSKYSVFNLVFANNPASIKIWDRLGFEVIGRVPGAARRANSEEMGDALIYGRVLQ